jgi:hypothetical protein
LRQNTTIKKLISFSLLVVFAVSTAPKAYFHDVFADHKDSAEACTDHTKTAHLHQNGINCHFDQLVVSSLYHFSLASIPEVNKRFLGAPHEEIQIFYHSGPFNSQESRGPPSAS